MAKLGRTASHLKCDTHEVNTVGSNPTTTTNFNMKTLKVKKKEFKKALNELCHKHNVIIDDSFTIVYTRKKYWDVSRVEVNTHPYKSVSDVGMKLLHK